ncbi:MAG: sigma-70 family RNA polymerase sigma factor [Ruminococcus sp.]|nr:sigma-70 family RNA polymerase sigma factor [Ruminococcus sp.]
MRQVKRRRDKDNPYILENDHIIRFVDSKGYSQKINISDEIYKTFNRFELEDLKYMNEYDRHTEHISHTDEMLYKKATRIHKELEEAVLDKIFYDYIFNEIDKLPLVERRRVKMYYLEEMTLKQIASKEKCSPRAVKYSIDIALKKILKKVKF